MATPVSLLDELTKQQKQLAVLNKHCDALCLELETTRAVNRELNSRLYEMAQILEAVHRLSIKHVSQVLNDTKEVLGRHHGS